MLLCRKLVKVLRIYHVNVQLYGLSNKYKFIIWAETINFTNFILLRNLPSVVTPSHVPSIGINASQKRLSLVNTTCVVVDPMSMHEWYPGL